MSDDEDEDVSGVGLFSVLTQESTNADNTVGVKRISGLEGKIHENILFKIHFLIDFL